MLHIVIVLLTLIFDRSKVIQYTNRGACQTHVIPQLLTLFNTQRRDCFTLYHNVTFA